MPYYDYKCTGLNCDNTFELLLRISQRHDPENEPCQKCGGAVIMKIAAPCFAYDSISTSVKPHRVDREFRNRLQDIKSSHHGANMNIPP